MEAESTDKNPAYSAEQDVGMTKTASSGEAKGNSCFPADDKAMSGVTRQLDQNSASEGAQISNDARKPSDYILMQPQIRNTVLEDVDVTTEDVQAPLQDGAKREERSQSATDTEGGQADSEPVTGWEERVGRVVLFGVPIVSLHVPEGGERLCLAQISNLLLQDFSYNEIHNRRVALGITCLQCTPSQMEVLRRAGAMPVSSRRCGLITKREAERLVRSFIADVPPPRLPDNFTFRVRHSCGWGCEGVFVPARYNSSRAKCIKCSTCLTYFSPNKFIFHFHRNPNATYRHPDAANFNSWRRHLELVHDGNDDRLLHAWEDVKAMFNGGCRRRFSVTPSSSSSSPSSFQAPFNQTSRSVQEPDSSLSFKGAFRSYESTMPPSLSQPISTDHVRRNCVDSHSSSINQEAKLGVQLPRPMLTGGQSILPSPTMPPSPQNQFVSPALGGVSYGEFLRSMSLPYNNMNNSLMAASNSTCLVDWYRAQAVPGFLYGNVPGAWGSNPFPMPCLGYPPYAVGAKGDNHKNQTAFQESSGEPPKVGMPNYIGDNAFRTGLDLQNRTALGVTELTARGLAQRLRADNSSHSKAAASPGTAIHDKKETTANQKPASAHSANGSVVFDVDISASRNSPKGNSAELSVEHSASAIVDVIKEEDENVEEEELKVDDDVCAPVTVRGECKSSNGPPEEDMASGNNFGDESGTEETKSEAVTNSEEQENERPSLPHDTASLLQMFEESEDTDMLLQLPAGKLRRILKMAKAKTRAVEKEQRKLMEMQGLQRLRAAELREEFSRQFLAIKENIWADIEQERRLKTALLERLAEIKQLVPKIPSLSMFPKLD